MKINNLFNIGDIVELIHQSTKTQYMVYSITISYWNKLSYTICDWTDYYSVDEWQLQLYVPPEPIWLQTKE